MTWTIEQIEEAADVLAQAADHIATFGHHKGWFDDGRDKCCAAGAIHRALGGPSMDPPLSVAVRDLAFAALSEIVNPLHARPQTVSEWNDKPKRTAEEVVNALMEASVRLRNGEFPVGFKREVTIKPVEILEG